MTVPSSVNKHSYNGNGSTTQWPWTFTLPKISGLDDTSVIQVYILNSSGVQTQLSSSDFDVDSVNKKIIYPKAESVLDPLSSSERIVLIRKVEEKQNLDLENQGHFKADEIEAGLDALEMQIQQNSEAVKRSLKVPETATNDEGEAFAEAIFTAHDEAVASAAAADNSATAAAGSATSASNSATTATTKASEASDSATAASGYATAASGSATSAGNSATTATTKAAEAANSAEQAAASAEEAKIALDNKQDDLNLYIDSDGDICQA